MCLISLVEWVTHAIHVRVVVKRVVIHVCLCVQHSLLGVVHVVVRQITLLNVGCTLFVVVEQIVVTTLVLVSSGVEKVAIPSERLLLAHVQTRVEHV